jgi:23S rRNA (guanosine2251-2'-O)-methyltransferase
MAKRDNPRYKSEAPKRGKNSRAAHSQSGKSLTYERGSGGRSDRNAVKAGGRTASTRGSRAYGDQSGQGRGSRAYGDQSGQGRSFGKGSGRYQDAPVRPAKGPQSGEGFEVNPNLIIGRNPVMEAVKSGRTIDKIMMQKDGEGSIKRIAALARDEGIQIQYVDKIVLDKLAPGKAHQGIAAYAAAHDYADLEDILEAAAERGEDPLIVLLDGLEDPHNLGAIMRSVDGAGAHGVVIPSRRSVSLTDTVAKASAGAIEYVPVAKVSNLAQTIDELKAKGIWIAAVDMDGEPYSGADLTGPLALVIGAEGAGVSRLIKEKCDFCVSIPMRGRVNSLNASNAAAIVLYEAERQRHPLDEEPDAGDEYIESDIAVFEADEDYDEGAEGFEESEGSSKKTPGASLLAELGWDVSEEDDN